MRPPFRDGQVTLTNIMTVRRGDKVRRYYRSKGHPLVRLPDAPLDSAVFLAAYAAAKDAVPVRAAPAPGTLAGLCRAALASDRYLASGKATRAMFRRHIDAVTEAHGMIPAVGIRTRHIVADVAGSTAPGHRLRTWRFLCSFGAATGLLRTDEARAATAPPAPKSDGHPPWAAAEIAAYRARWQIGTTPRAAMELLHWTGARISDAVRIGLGMVDRGGVLTFRQAKTGDPAFVPWHCALPAYASAMLDD